MREIPHEVLPTCLMKKEFLRVAIYPTREHRLSLLRSNIGAFNASIGENSGGGGADARGKARQLLARIS